MDHMWEAPKKSLAPIFLKKLAIILRQDFLRTLYMAGHIRMVLVSVQVSCQILVGHRSPHLGKLSILVGIIMTNIRKASLELISANLV